MALPIQRCCLQIRALTLLWLAAGYHAQLRPQWDEGIYKPSHNDPETKLWHKGLVYVAKLYGRYGGGSGVKPEELWPSPELQEAEEEKREWKLSLREMQQQLEIGDQELERAQRKREQLITTNMGKMPKMVEDWHRAKKKARQKECNWKAHKKHLLTLTCEKFGIQINCLSAKFQEMVKKEKKKMKAMKNRKGRKRG